MSDYARDWLPPGLEVRARDDLLMWRRRGGPLSARSWANRVAWLRTTAAAVEGLIDEALAFLGPFPFSWVVGPSSQPDDLAVRLQRRGLVDTGDGDLLTAELPIEGLRSAPEVRIEEVVDERAARIGLELAHREAPPAEIDELLAERMAYLGQPNRRGGFLVAWIGDEPVANAGYRYSADGQTVYLNGAETVARWRGRGVYQALVRHRTEAAFRRGCRYAAVRARRDTSLPILLRRGFIDHGHLPLYARPAE